MLLKKYEKLNNLYHSKYEWRQTYAPTEWLHDEHEHKFTFFNQKF